MFKRYLTVLFVILGLVSCKEQIVPAGDGSVILNLDLSCDVSIDFGTKAASSTGTKFEVFLYNGSGVLETYETWNSASFYDFTGTVSSVSGVPSIVTVPGGKTIYVIAGNWSFTHQQVPTLADMQNMVFRLADGYTGTAVRSIPLVGSTTVTLDNNAVQNVAVSIKRLVSKVSLGTVRLASSDAMNSAGVVTLQSVFLMNAVTSWRMDNSWDYASNVALWSNFKGLDASLDASLASFLFFNSGSSLGTLNLSVGCSFLAFPNYTTSDTFADNDSPRFTSLVLKVHSSVYGVMYYALPFEMGQNKVYKFNSVTIQNIGTDNPLLPPPAGAVDVDLVVSVEDWGATTTEDIED